MSFHRTPSSGERRGTAAPHQPCNRTGGAVRDRLANAAMASAYVTLTGGWMWLLFLGANWLLRAT
ncbi:MAG: hypothetical protein RIM84_23420 [Alphaproteobacteria bacterium]